ncbi:MAG: sulfotransferase [Acidimicrobiales bacterium]
MTSADDHVAARTVVFIAGAGRSGSTLLNALLGQSPDVVAVGELRYLWERGILAHRDCSCGESVATCGTWAEVIARVGADGPTAEAMTEDLEAVVRVRSLFGRRSSKAEMARRRVVARVQEVYTALEEVTGRRVFVDSSKRPMWGRVLAHLDDADLRVVHLVRDPRATAWSWQRHKSLHDGGPPVMQQLSPWRAAPLWILWNVTTEVLFGRTGAYRCVSYDRLAREPSVVVGEILEWAGAAPADCFGGANVASLRPIHAIAGNADRLRLGRVEIRADDEWRRAMPGAQRALVGLATAPFRRRYLAPHR